MFCGTSCVSASATLTMPSWRNSSPVMLDTGLAEVTLGDWMREPVTCTSASSSISPASSRSASAATTWEAKANSAAAATAPATDARTIGAQAINLDTAMLPGTSWFCFLIDDTRHRVRRREAVIGSCSRQQLMLSVVFITAEGRLCYLKTLFAKSALRAPDAIKVRFPSRQVDAPRAH